MSRLVNGVSDAQQAGRVAAPVSRLAANAGLPPLLVELRHSSTHNILPTLSTLRCAAQQALDWLLNNYW